MSPLQTLLDRYRAASATPREQGTYFEELTVAYLKNEPAYRELYRDVMPYAEWAERQGLDKRDAGIDLIAETVTGEVHAIQCKLYASDYRVQKADIDSFFTASGKKPFTRRFIFSTTNLWTDHAEEALRDQHTPVTKIDLAALESSAIDWSRFAPGKPVAVRPQKSLRPDQQNAVGKVLQGLATLDRGKLISARLSAEMKKRHDAKHMSVVFATYHLIDVIHQAHESHHLPAFDLIVCDEAHRTTGATFEGGDESHFVKVRDAAYIRSKKRLYMTAPPRI